jgi:hypothetical protein
LTQLIQVGAHKALQTVFQNPGPAVAPWQLRVFVSIPGIQKVMGRVIGVGILPEHVQTAKTPEKKCPARLVKRAGIVLAIAAAAVGIGTALFKTWRRRQPA